MDFNELWSHHSPCEWALLQGFQGHWVKKVRQPCSLKSCELDGF